MFLHLSVKYYLLSVHCHYHVNSLKIFCSDAYKEFEKEIQEDLQEVDDRLEEEEVSQIYIYIIF